MSNWIILHPENGDRYCQDKKWRYIALGGTYPSCVKVYKKQGWAQKQANKIKVNGCTRIISLGENQTMEASGLIITTLPSDKVGYVVHHHDIKPCQDIVTQV